MITSQEAQLVKFCGIKTRYKTKNDKRVFESWNYNLRPPKNKMQVKKVH